MGHGPPPYNSNTVKFTLLCMKTPKKLHYGLRLFHIFSLTLLYCLLLMSVSGFIKITIDLSITLSFLPWEVKLKKAFCGVILFPFLLKVREFQLVLAQRLGHRILDLGCG